MANCILQSRHWPATVSRNCGDAAGRCAPSKRRALTAAPSGARPLRCPPPARTGGLGVERPVRLVCHQAGSVPRSAGLLEVGPPAARSTATRWLRTGVSASLLKAKVPARHAGRPSAAIVTTATAGMRRAAGNAPGNRSGGTAQRPPTRASGGISGYHTGDLYGGDNGRTGRVGRGRADRCLRTRPGGARRSTSLPGAKPARDGRRGNAATDHPEHAACRTPA